MERERANESSFPHKSEEWLFFHLPGLWEDILLSFWKANDSRFAVAQFSVHHPHSPHLFVTLHQALISPQMFAVQACSSERMHGSAVCFRVPRHHSMPGKTVPGMSELYWVVKLQNGPRVNNPEFWSLKLVSEISIIDTLPLGGGHLIDLPRANQWSFKHSSFILLLEMRRAPPPSLGHRFFYLPIQLDELAYTVLASSAEPEHVVSNHGTPWDKTDVNTVSLQGRGRAVIDCA